MSDTVQNNTEETGDEGTVLVTTELFVGVTAPDPMSEEMEAHVVSAAGIVEAVKSAMQALAPAARVVADAYAREADRADFEQMQQLNDTADAVLDSLQEAGLGEDGRTLMEVLASMTPLPDDIFGEDGEMEPSDTDDEAERLAHAGEPRGA